jgi:hypothetical protein
MGTTRFHCTAKAKVLDSKRLLKVSLKGWGTPSLVKEGLGAYARLLTGSFFLPFFFMLIWCFSKALKIQNKKSPQSTA